MARRTVARGSRACLTRARGSCHSVASSDVESTPARHPGSGLGSACAVRLAYARRRSRISRRTSSFSERSWENRPATRRTAFGSRPVTRRSKYSSERCWSSSAPLSSLASTMESMPSSPGSRVSACWSVRSRRLSSRRARRWIDARRRREHELDAELVLDGGEHRDERLSERVLVVAGRLDRQDERRALLEPHDAARPGGLAVDFDQLDVGVEVFQWPADGGHELGRGGDGEADREVGEAVDLEREVVGATPGPLVPAAGDRAGDALEGLLDVVGLGEVVASEPQLPPRGRSRPRAAVKQSADDDEEGRDAQQQHGDADLGDTVVEERDRRRRSARAEARAWERVAR